MKGNKIPRLIGLALVLTLQLGGVPYDSSAIAEAALKGDSLKGKVITKNGSPVNGAQVQLVGPKLIMMDVTTTGNDGRFTLDLGILEDEELAKLEQFTVVISKQGREVKKGLDSGATSNGSVVRLEAIELP